MAKHEQVKLELGESTTLSAKDGIKSDDNRLSKDGTGKWGSTNSAAVIKSDDLTKDSVEVVGASIGKSLVFYRQDAVLTPEETLATSLGAGAPDAKRQIEDQYAVAFEVEVVAKPEKVAGKAADGKSGKSAAAAVAGANPPLASSNKFDGRLPMNEAQEEPSEKTPYGMDQDNKPVAPFPGMVNPQDDSSVARQSETAESGKPSEPAASNKNASKSSTKSSTKRASKKK
jgi:hypothetical protein